MSHSRYLAPVALFVYKRPEHARRTIENLIACPEADQSPIFVFADGPKSEADAEAVEATRAVVDELLGDRATVVTRDRNRGLANSIIAGTTELCDKYGEVIVVEDDLLLAPSFLRFLNEGLERYRHDPRVMQVSGHQFDVPALARSGKALFLPMTSSWGWATWKRAWDLFDPAATGWRERLTGAEARRFNLEGAYDFTSMLERQMTRGIDSWAIRWYYSVFSHSGLVLWPPCTLVRHEGLDGTGTHSRLRRARQAPVAWGSGIWSMPDTVEISVEFQEVCKAVKATNKLDALRSIPALLRRHT